MMILTIMLISDGIVPLGATGSSPGCLSSAMAKVGNVTLYTVRQFPN